MCQKAESVVYAVHFEKRSSLVKTTLTHLFSVTLIALFLSVLGAAHALTGLGHVDSLQIYSLRDSALELAPTAPLRALDYATRAEALSIRYADDTALSKVLNAKGLAYEYLDSLDRALSEYERARQAAKRVGDANFEANLINAKGIACYYAGDRLKAHTFYDEALAKFEALDDLTGQGKVLNNLGVLYRNSGKHEQAIEVYLKSLVIKKALGDSIGVANTCNNLGYAYAYIEKDSISLVFFERALAIYTANGDQENMALIKTGLGISSYNLGHPEVAVAYLESSHPVIQKNKNWEYMIHILAYGRSLFDLGRIAESKPYIEEGYELLLQTSERKSLLRYAELYMYQLARSESKLDKALIHLENYKSLSDSLTSDRNERLFSEMQAKYELHAKENTILKQELEIKEATQSRAKMAGGVLLFVLLALSAGSYGYVKQKANKSLSEQKRIVERALDDRELMLREIHHRVKNNLQIISGLLSIQSNTINDQAAKDALNLSRSRVRSMSLIHQNLYQDGEKFTRVEMGNYIQRLAHEVIDTMADEDCEIATKIHVDVDELDVDVAIPMGLILNELITNAVKYAFVGQSQGQIEIGLRHTGNHIALDVVDNGVGMDQSKVGLGFGHRMIESLSESMGAEFSTVSNNGVRARLVVPYKSKA